jgi:hypothetical protein
MRTSRLTIAVALAGLAAAAPAGASRSFNGNVCGLVSAGQLATIKGVSTHCAKARPLTGPGSTMYTANWAGKTSSSPRLQVTVALYTDPGALTLAKRNLKQGFPGGTPRRVAGIGTAAYEASGAGATGIHFAVGKHVVYITLSGKLRSKAPLEALAKAIAARL